jgi:hypothetical protein
VLNLLSTLIKQNSATQPSSAANKEINPLEKTKRVALDTTKDYEPGRKKYPWCGFCRRDNTFLYYCPLICRSGWICPKCRDDWRNEIK